MKSSSILLMFHCCELTGYAIEKLEHVFLSAARWAGYNSDQIFWSYNGLKTKTPNKLSCDYNDPPDSLLHYIKINNISIVLAFDLGYPCKILKILKKTGLVKIISYWGASISDLNVGLKLILKRFEFRLRLYKPDLFIFESESMRLRATNGRGIPKSVTRVINLGVDCKKYYPETKKTFYVHEQFKLPYETKVIFYSGHMEERKGINTIIKAAINLIEQKGLNDIHFILCGNKNDEAQPYLNLLKGSIAKNYVTFGGYRSDIPQLMRSSFLGVIASTGWDSFTMSSVEMMASGLPLIVSNLQGLSETIIENKNGFKITPGNEIELADRIYTLYLDPNLAASFSNESRRRALKHFSLENQILKISEIIKMNSVTL